MDKDIDNNMAEPLNILTKEMRENANLADINEYIKHGGYQALEKALKTVKPTPGPLEFKTDLCCYLVILAT